MKNSEKLCKTTHKKMDGYLTPESRNCLFSWGREELLYAVPHFVCSTIQDEVLFKKVSVQFLGLCSSGRENRNWEP